MDVSYSSFHQDKSFHLRLPSEVHVLASGMAEQKNRREVCLDRFGEKQKGNHLPFQ